MCLRYIVYCVLCNLQCILNHLIAEDVRYVARWTVKLSVFSFVTLGTYSVLSNERVFPMENQFFYQSLRYIPKLVKRGRQPVRLRLYKYYSL